LSGWHEDDLPPDVFGLAHVVIPYVLGEVITYIAAVYRDILYGLIIAFSLAGSIFFSVWFI
jgi:hypothetical protein